MMRVALFTDSYDQENGMSTTYQSIMNELVGRDIQVDIYVYHDPTKRLRHLDVNGNIRVFRFCPTLPYRYYQDLQINILCRDKPVYCHFDSQHRSQPYDLIHIASCAGMSQIGLKIAKKYKLPIVGIYHTDLMSYTKCRYGHLASIFAKHLTKKAYNQCDLVLVPSQAYADEISTFIDAQIRLLKRGIDVDLFSPSRREEPSIPVILYAGRLSVEKNIPMLVDVYRSLGVDAKLQIIGKGPLHEELKSEEGIEVIPYMDKEDLARYYASATVFAFPSITDVFGNVVLESLSSGTPAVVMSHGGPKEIVKHGSTGYVAENEEEFKSYIEKACMDNSIEMRESAKQYALTQSWGVIADALLSYYLDVLNKR